ncbi:MAG: ribonuclease [Lachnospiraceae bacterium]|nr:ribonuclease [Lachnospiraceae bacterium]
MILLLVFALLLSGCKSKDDKTSAAATTADLAGVTETFGPEQTTKAVPSGETTKEAPAETTTEAQQATRAPETTTAPATAAPPETTKAAIDENGKYYSKDEVALYIHTYGHLPSNYVTKKEAKAAGWTGGSLEPWFPGCAIGGDYFGNYEGLLPKKKGRTYYECDIDTKGKRSRGAKRIIYSNDGYIYYTDDHYESFTELYKGGAS